MNGNYYQNPTFPSMDDIEITPVEEKEKQTPEFDYIEELLQLNVDKKAKVYASYPNSNTWQNKEYDGIIKQVGKDYLIVLDPKDDIWYLIKMSYIDYVEFNEKMNYL